MSIQRTRVLSLYRQVLRLSKKWTAASGNNEDSRTESNYIKNEAQSLFRKNKNLTDDKLIEDCLHEATARMELALHYKNPYPRPVNMPPKSLAKRQGKEGSAQTKLKKQSTPIYIKSKVD